MRAKTRPQAATTRRVNFFCDAPAAEGVRLVGDFNGWDLATTPMHRMPDGLWMASLELNQGRHVYLFIVDGNLMLDRYASATIGHEQVSLITVR